MTARATLSLLGVTLNRLLRSGFGPHCQRLKSRTRPRLGHLRRLTGRDRFLGETQLRTMANGCMRGALEHAADAWLPSTSVPRRDAGAGDENCSPHHHGLRAVNHDARPDGRGGPRSGSGKKDKAGGATHGENAGSSS